MFPGQSLIGVKFGSKPGGEIDLVGLNGVRPKGISATNKPSLVGNELFWATIDLQSGAAIQVQSARIPKEYFLQEAKPREQAKIEKKFNTDPIDYSIEWANMRQAHFLQDGSMYAIVESSYILGDETGTRYMFLDAALFHVNAAGELAWCRKILKEQTGDQKAFAKSCSVFSFVRGNNLHVLYNDHVSNHPREEVGKAREYTDEKSNSYLVLETVTPEGEQTRDIVRTNADAEFHITPRQMSFMPDGSIFVMGSKGGKTWLGNLTIKP
jgi:hypothetical protein